MTVERSWRIDYDSPTSPGTYGVVQFEEGQPYEHVGVLVPDIRLQAITDAWNEFTEAKSLRSYPLEVNTWNRMFDLLDALTEEEQ